VNFGAVAAGLAALRREVCSRSADLAHQDGMVPDGEIKHLGSLIVTSDDHDGETSIHRIWLGRFAFTEQVEYYLLGATTYLVLRG
jgi:hypothetical protein